MAGEGWLCDEFQIDPVYENICSPKFFDLAREEEAEEIAAVEEWFDFAGADAEAPQVVRARLAGKSLSPLSAMEITEAKQEASSVAKEDTTLEDEPFLRMTIEPDFEFPLPAAAAHLTPGFPEMGRSGGSQRIRLHPMVTRSMTKSISEAHPSLTADRTMLTPGSIIIKKSLYSRLCKEVESGASPSSLNFSGSVPSSTQQHAAVSRKSKNSSHDSEQLQQSIKRQKVGNGLLQENLHVSVSSRSTATHCTMPTVRTEEWSPKHDAEKENKSPTLPQMEKVQRKPFQNMKVETLHSTTSACKTSNHHSSVVAQRSVGRCTKPVEFHLKTEDRIRRKEALKEEKAPYVSLMERVHNFQNKTPERFHNGSKAFHAHDVQQPMAHVTKPIEIHLHTEDRARHTDAEKQCKSPYVPLMERVERFQKKTPERFHSIPSSQVYKPQSDQAPLHLTIPKEPHFQTAHRARQSKMKSREEREDEEMATMPKFKARPILRGCFTLPEVAKQSLTEFQEFHLTTTEKFSVDPQKAPTHPPLVNQPR